LKKKGGPGPTRQRTGEAAYPASTRGPKVLFKKKGGTRAYPAKDGQSRLPGKYEKPKVPLLKKKGDQALPGKYAEPRILEGETRAYPAGAGKKPTRQVRTGSPGFSKTKEAYPASTGEAGSPKASQKATEGDLPTRQPQTLLEEPESSLFKRTSPLGNPQFSKVSPERRHTRQPLAGMRLILGPPSLLLPPPSLPPLGAAAGKRANGESVSIQPS